MIGRRCALIALAGLLILILTVNIYFIRMIVENSSENFTDKINKVSADDKSGDSNQVGRFDVKDKILRKSITREMEVIINSEMRLLPSKYFKRNSSYLILENRLMNELNLLPNADENIWNIPNNNWPDAQHLLPPVAPELGTILESLRKAKIVKVDNAGVGTQLKLMVTLEPNIKALFKPQWYSRDTILHGPVYFGKDRHNGEVVAFHLASILGLRRVPLTVIRKLNLKEVRMKASPNLFETMYEEGNETCFYGVCHYCSPADPICSSSNHLEGALILWLPPFLKLIKHRHPWQRTYKRSKLAPWETDRNYCDKVKESKSYAPNSSSRLLDLVDTAIFDFLMDNGDRHHYEVMQDDFHNPAVLLIDNGKSLANPDVDHIDILAPLYQCCMIHKSTWDRLQLLSGGALSSFLSNLVDHESKAAQVSPLITPDHLSAFDRRLLAIFATVEYCLKKASYPSSVILDHR